MLTIKCATVLLNCAVICSRKINVIQELGLARVINL